jgi:membrane-associated HD superfamily phosphohydrolase
LRCIGESFKSSLVSMLHARVAYPKREEKEPASSDRRSARPAA